MADIAEVIKALEQQEATYRRDHDSGAVDGSWQAGYDWGRARGCRIAIEMLKPLLPKTFKERGLKPFEERVQSAARTNHLVVTESEWLQIRSRVEPVAPPFDVAATAAATLGWDIEIVED